MVGMPKQKYELAISLRGSENRLVWMQDKFAFFVYTGIQFIQDPKRNGATLSEEVVPPV